MRFVLYVSKLPRNLLLVFVERVFVSANGLVCDVPERIAYKTRFAGFMRLSRWINQNKTQTTQVSHEASEATPLSSEFAKRRHDAIRSQMLHGGLR